MKLSNRSSIFWRKENVGGKPDFFFVSAAAIMLLYFAGGMNGMGIGQAGGLLLIALAASIVELVSMNGWDNLTVPLVVMAGLWIWFSFVEKTLV